MKKTNKEIFIENEFGIILKSIFVVTHEIIEVINKEKFINLILLLIENEDVYNEQLNRILSNGYSKQDAIESLSIFYENAILSSHTHFMIDIDKSYFTILMRKKKISWLLTN